MIDANPEFSFLMDIGILGENARRQIANGAATQGYGGDAALVCRF